MTRLFLIIQLLNIFIFSNVEAITNNKQLISFFYLRENIQVKIIVDRINANKESKSIIEYSFKINNSYQEEFIVAKIMSGGAILRDVPSSTGKTIATIPGNETINVFKYQQNLYFKVSYKGQIGFVSYSTIEQNQQIDDFLIGKEQVKQDFSTKTIIRTVNESDPRYQKLIKLYGKEKALKIMNGELWQGMSYGMVLESIGKPNSKSSVNSSDGVKDQWIYSDYNLDFINGELKNWTKK